MKSDADLEALQGAWYIVELEMDGRALHGAGANMDGLETRDVRRVIANTCFSIEPGIYLEGKFGVRSEINVYVSDKDIEVTGQPIQTEVIPILKK